MPLNIPGLLVPFHLLVNPRLIVPHVVVKDIRQIDFRALKKAGYRGAVFDKDNCLTLPHRDTLIPELQDSWRECREIFGEDNVLIVSNSAGTKQLDAGGIQAESVSYHLGVPVLRHSSPKPSYACIKGIRSYFVSLRAARQSSASIFSSPFGLGTTREIEDSSKEGVMERKSDFQSPQDSDLIIVGDRIFTDVVLANRMRPRRPVSTPEPSTAGPLAIWTTHVWEKESMLMRWAEGRLVRAVEAWTKPRSPSPSTPTSDLGDGSENQNGQYMRFVKDVRVDEYVKGSGRESGGAAGAAAGTGGVGRWIWDRMRS